MINASTLKTIALIFALINVKSLPLVFHIKFLYYFVKHFYVLRGVKPKSVFQTRSYVTHTSFMEMDFNFHKSNSTYFSDLDMARTDMMMHVFKDFFVKFKDAKTDKTTTYWPYTPLGGVCSVFRQEILPYQPFRIKTRVLGWDHKWIFIMSRFETLGGKLCAVSLSKYVFKMKRKTIPPEEVIEFCGLKTPQVVEQGKMDFEKARHMIHLESLEHETYKTY